MGLVIKLYMTNRFLFWAFGCIFVIAVALTGIRVFVIRDYPLITEESSEEIGENEDGTEEVLKLESDRDDMTEDDAYIDSELIQESAD